MCVMCSCSPCVAAMASGTTTNDILALTGQNAEHRWNSQADLGTAAVVTYSFPTTAPGYLSGEDRFGWQAFSAAQQADVRTAFEIWGAQGGISFVEVPPEVGGAIRLQHTDIYDANPFDLGFTAGYAYLPYPIYVFDPDQGDLIQRNPSDDVGGDVFMNADVYSGDAQAFDPSGDGFSVLLHEIGHAIGFKHPFSGDPTIDPDHDNWEHTVMTYGPAGDNSDIGTVDKEALAYLYGTHNLNGSWDREYDAVVQHGGNAGRGEVLTGWDKNDIIHANGGNDTVNGFAGKDRVFDGTGNDIVRLGLGDDYLRVGSGRDSFYGGQGRDYISYYDSDEGVMLNFDTQQVSGGWADNDTISGFESGSGSGTGDDLIYGSGEANTLKTYGGKDSVYGGGGADRIALGSGDDYVRIVGNEDFVDGGSGKDYISFYDSAEGVTVNLATDSAGNMDIDDFESAAGSRMGADEITGTSGSNTIRTYGGDDRVYAKGGSDKVELGSGNDYARVGGGAESFFGGSGIDYISYYDSSNGVRLDLRDDEASGSWAVNDVVDDFEGASGSGTGDDVLLGTNGTTKFRGYGGDDKLYGRGGNDKLYGGDGDDFFDGGADADSLYGGAGADVFHFDQGEDVDVVKDFENNIDTIELDGFAAGFDAFDYAEQVGNDVVFDFDGGDHLTIENTSILALRNDLDVV